MMQRQLSEIKNFQKPLHELTLAELFATSGCGETRPPPAGLAFQGDRNLPGTPSSVEAKTAATAMGPRSEPLLPPSLNCSSSHKQSFSSLLAANKFAIIFCYKHDTFERRFVDGLGVTP